MKTLKVSLIGLLLFGLGVLCGFHLKPEPQKAVERRTGYGLLIKGVSRDTITIRRP